MSDNVWIYILVFACAVLQKSIIFMGNSIGNRSRIFGQNVYLNLLQNYEL